MDLHRGPGLDAAKPALNGKGMPTRRAVLAALSAVAFSQDAAAQDDVWRALAAPGHVALMRHAAAPGVGDPPNFRLGDCATQRNLSEAGRRAATRLGEDYRARGVRAARVLSSEWCRCLDTARLMDVGPVEPAPDTLNSFFEERGERERRTGALRRLLASLPRDGATVVLVTHQVNITALTGVFPDSGETVVLRLTPNAAFEIAGRLKTP